MGILLATCAALVYGAADFVGGMASKRTSTWSVAALSQIFGVLFLLLVFPLLHSGAARGGDLLWGGIAGIAGAGAVGFLYRGLAIGRMSVVSPITAVLAAALPVVWGVARGERPSVFAYVGIALALGAVVLVSSASAEPTEAAARVRGLAPGIPQALIAGTGFGLFFIFLAHTSPDSGVWPLIGARAASIALLLAVALVTRNSILPAQGTLGPIALSGLLDMGANVLYLLSTKFALLAIAAVITSLYPASTVLLARMVLHERLNARQWSGVAAAGAGVVLIALR